MKPVTGLEDFFPQDRLDVLDQGRDAEIHEMLEFLGYIRRDEMSGASVEEAFHRFRVDAFSENLFQQFLFSFEEDPLPSRLSFKINPIEYKALTEMTSLEGDFISNSLPELGSVTLTSRIIRYRLKILGLSDRQVSSAFDMEAIEGLNKIKQWLKSSSILETVNLSGDIPAIIRIVIETPELSDRIIYFASEESDSHHLSLDDPLVRIEFLEKLKKNLPRKSKALKEFRRNALDKDLDFIAVKMGDPFNSFLFRLLQVQQWMSGFYRGEIGQRTASISFESILEYLRFERESGKIDMSLWHVVAHITDRFWAFNIMYYFNEIKELYQDPTTMNDVMEEFKKVSSARTNDDFQMSSIAVQRMDELWSSNNIGMHTLDSSPRANFYHGAKTVIKRIGKVLTKVFDWFRDKLTQLINWLKSVVKIIYRELREGIQVFAHGMKFVFGKREIITRTLPSGVVATKFDLDADGIVFASSDLNSKKDIKDHVEKTTFFGSSLMFSLTLTGKIIHWAIGLVTGGTWAEVLVKIAQIFHEMVKEWLTKKKFQKTAIEISY
jgi:hypothetical protein